MPCACSAEIDDVTGISACYNNLGSVCYARSDLAHALHWYEHDTALLQQRGAWTDLAATLHNLGHVALEQGNHEQAPPLLSARAATCTLPSISTNMWKKKKRCSSTS